MKRTLLVLVCGVILAGCLSGCVFPGGESRIYSETYLTVFDTVTTITGTAANEAEFQKAAQNVYDELLFYHRLFDIYTDYPGLANLKTVNDMAGIAPVQVDAAVVHFLEDCKRVWAETDGLVNSAMGSVLMLWHAAREAGLAAPEKAALPDWEQLSQAAAHTDFRKVHLDPAASTVYLSDRELRLDVGALAKGWAVQRVAENAPEGMLISVGGNICATGPKDEKGTPWIIGIQNPDGGDAYLHTLRLERGCVVTSGDYQRVYMVEGKAYHHIIDPETLYPGEYWRSVTVICPDSGEADALSTALFLLPQAQGQELLHRFGAEAMWVDAAGNRYYSSGFAEYIQS